MDHVGAERRAAESVGAVRVVVELDLERDQPVFAQIHGLDRHALLEIPEMQAATVFQMADLFEVEARHEGVGGRPFRADHHVVAGLVPEIVAERDVAHRVFPAADDLEILVEMQIAARRLALGIAQEGNDDLGPQAMHRMRAGEISLPLDVGAVDDLVQSRRAGIGRRVHHVDVVRSDPGHQQVLARHRGVVVAGGTGVPAHVVQLVPDPRHLEPVDHLAVGRAFGIGVDRRQIVGFLDARPGVDRDGVEQLFARRLDRFGR